MQIPIFFVKNAHFMAFFHHFSMLIFHLFLSFSHLFYHFYRASAHISASFTSYRTYFQGNICTLFLISFTSFLIFWFFSFISFSFFHFQKIGLVKKLCDFTVVFGILITFSGPGPCSGARTD